MIKSFCKQYEFLSNFYPCIVEYEGEKYSSVERAYQASKSLDPNIRKMFKVMSTSMEARRWGNKIELREDWNTARYEIMEQLLRNKFSNSALKRKLLDTGDEYLEEENRHGDMYWGTVDGKGSNNLGKLLMKIRKEISDEDTSK